jgi:hypothetical protein
MGMFRNWSEVTAGGNEIYFTFSNHQYYWKSPDCFGSVRGALPSGINEYSTGAIVGENPSGEWIACLFLVCC